MGLGAFVHVSTLHLPVCAVERFNAWFRVAFHDDRQQSHTNSRKISNARWHVSVEDTTTMVRLRIPRFSTDHQIISHSITGMGVMAKNKKNETADSGPIVTYGASTGSQPIQPSKRK